MKDYIPEITGHLDIFVADNEDDFDGEVVKWRDVMIHGDPEGLKSLATPATASISRLLVRACSSDLLYKR